MLKSYRIPGEPRALVYTGRLGMLVPSMGTNGGNSSNRSNRADVLTNKEGGGQAKASHMGGAGRCPEVPQEGHAHSGGVVSPLC